VNILCLGGDTLDKNKQEQEMLDNIEKVEVKEEVVKEQSVVEEVAKKEKNAKKKDKQKDANKEQKEIVLPENEGEQEDNNGNRRLNNITMEKKKRLVGLNKGLLITAIILVILAVIVAVFVLANRLNNNVYHNTYLNGVNMEGKTEAEVAKYISELNEEFKTKNLVIKDGDKEIIQITPANIDMAIDELATKSKIMDFGRNDNWVNNNINILKNYFNKQEIDIVYSYSETKLGNLAAEVAAGIEGKVIDDSFTVDEKNKILVITKGKEGKNIVTTEFKEAVLNQLKDNNSAEYSIVLEDSQPKELDVDIVYAQVAKDAKDAYVDNSVKPAIYHKHELGITFDKEELRRVLASEENKVQGKVIKFNLSTTKPAVTIQDITKDLYRDTLGTYTSGYVNSDANRASNVVLAAKMLNGTIIMPGETFSFNKVMGDCGLSSRGFKSAAVFKNGKVVQEIGGGVCQISSTLYIAALYANMSIVSRSNHALPVGYVPASLDATIYYPYTDFKFKNTREYPVKIVAKTTSSRKLTISICGTKEDVEYEIVLTSQKTGSIAPKVQQQKNSSLAIGETKQIQAGSYGYTSVAYKTVKLNGKVISKTLLSEDSYASTPKIIAVGTKQVNVYGE